MSSAGKIYISQIVMPLSASQPFFTGIKRRESERPPIKEDNFTEGLNRDGDGTKVYAPLHESEKRPEYSGQIITLEQMYSFSQTSNVARSLAREYELCLPDFRIVLKNAFDPMVKDGSIKINYRAKGIHAIKEKLAAKEIYSREGAVANISDGLGARIIMKDAGCNDARRLVETLIEAIKSDNGKFVSIDEVKDYCSETKYSILNKGGYSLLNNFIQEQYGISIDQKSKKSGYTATHILGKMNLKSSKGAKPTILPFEIQITSENVLKLCGPEHELFKIFGNKGIEEEFYAVSDAINLLSAKEKKEYLNYVSDAYILQRQKDIDPKGYSGEKLLPIPGHILEDAPFDTDILDLNNIAVCYERLERRLAAEENIGDIAIKPKRQRGGTNKAIPPKRNDKTSFSGLQGSSKLSIYA